MSEPTDAEIQAALTEAYKDVAPPFMASVSDYPISDEWPPSGSQERRDMLDAFRAEQEEAERQNHEWMRRVLRAAYQARGFNPEGDA